MCSGGFQGTEVQLSTKADRCTEVKHWYFYHHYTKPMLCAVNLIKMVTIKTKHGEFKYKDWQWNLAWLLVFLCGVAVGIIGGL